jgi:hypothetical protein
MSRIPRTLCAFAFALPLAPAWAADTAAGTYGIAAAGPTSYEYTSGLFETDTASATGLKIGLGHRFGGVFALEGWAQDFGRADIRAGVDRLRTRSLGVSGAWHWPLSPGAQFVLRVGGAQASERRTDSANGTRQDYRRTYVTAGLGVSVDIVSHLALEFMADAADEPPLGGQIYSLTFGARWRF